MNIKLKKKASMEDKEKKTIDVLMKDYEILKTYSTITSTNYKI